MLSPAGISTLIQTATIQALGLTAPAAYAAVRIDWPTEGQPAWGIGEDVVCIGALLVDDPTDKQRDLVMGTDGGGNPLETITEQAVWRISWTFYGPHATAHARKVRGALFWQATHDLLADNALYVVTNVPQAIRAPEYFQGQWWERCDLSAEFNEGVTDTYAPTIAESVEVIVETQDDTVVADVAIT